MPSILSRNNQTDQIQDPMEAASNLANQIMATPNPQETFDKMLQSNPELKKYYDMMNQYGNGNPHQAFLNYMGSNGKQSIGQQISQWVMSKLSGK